MDAYFSRYMLYYPSTFLKGEMIYKHTRNYDQQQYASLDEQAQYAEHKVAKIVSFARKHSSFYASRLARVDAAHSLSDAIQTIPFLQKSDLISHIDQIVTYKSKLASVKTTGGS